jgi:hypothetical protein
MLVVRLDDSNTLRSSIESRGVAGERWYVGFDTVNSLVVSKYGVIDNRY